MDEDSSDGEYLPSQPRKKRAPHPASRLHRHRHRAGARSGAAAGSEGTGRPSACIECHQARTRCIRPADDSTSCCERCLRLGRSCVTRPPRQTTRVACIHCIAAKRSCDAGRPCSRCVKKGWADRCWDRTMGGTAPALPPETSSLGRGRQRGYGGRLRGQQQHDHPHQLDHEHEHHDQYQHVQLRRSARGRKRRNNSLDAFPEQADQGYGGDDDDDDAGDDDDNVVSDEQSRPSRSDSRMQLALPPLTSSSSSSRGLTSTATTASLSTLTTQSLAGADGGTCASADASTGPSSLKRARISPHAFLYAAGEEEVHLTKQQPGFTVIVHSSALHDDHHHEQQQQQQQHSRTSSNSSIQSTLSAPSFHDKDGDTDMESNKSCYEGELTVAAAPPLQAQTQQQHRQLQLQLQVQLQQQKHAQQFQPLSSASAGMFLRVDDMPSFMDDLHESSRLDLSMPSMFDADAFDESKEVDFAGQLPLSPASCSTSDSLNTVSPNVSPFFSSSPSAPSALAPKEFHPLEDLCASDIFPASHSTSASSPSSVSASSSLPQPSVWPYFAEEFVPASSPSMWHNLL